MAIDTTYRGASVLVTGHTGFKGSWLCLLLNALGAKVTGVALPPPSEPSLYALLGIEQRLSVSHMLDVRDAEALRALIAKMQPDIVFHMAAQPLVLQAYADPVETFSTNIMGTVHVLDALRALKKPVAAVMVTSDKCYKNQESATPYVESDPLGGSDPYTASKACAEIVSQAYASAFFSAGDVAVATARAGNVLGGGDFGANRLVPDLYRVVSRGMPLKLRYPDAVRPWQYVLDVLWGYLTLGAALAQKKHAVADAYNFAPPDTTPVSVREIVARVSAIWGRAVEVGMEAPLHHETNVLRIDASKAGRILGWESLMDTDAMLTATAQWYERMLDGDADLWEFTQRQLNDYLARAKR
jgi:CDP-glucose 4,6-dehydratase